MASVGRKVMAMMLALASPWCVPVVRAQNIDTAREVHDFDISAQPLENALTQFSRVTAVSVLNDSASVAGKKNARVRGRMTVQQAILQLLGGTGLRARFTMGGSIAITAAKQADIMLDQLEAVSRPTIGQPATDPAWIAYADLVQRRIKAGIGSDAALAHGPYRFALKVWLGPEGRITRSAMLRGSGEGARDRRIVAALEAVPMGEKPPASLPQPLRLEFEVH